MAATIKDIAEYCNVSVGTVDRALNDRTGISKKTKERILEAVSLLDYRPNYIGRSLARGKTMTIGVVCFDLVNSFFPELIGIIEMLAKEKGYFIYLILTQRDFAREEEGLRYLSERHVDGIILFPIGLSRTYIEMLHNLKIPIVTIYNKLNDDFPFVSVNDRGAMADAVKFLAAKGYKKIVYLTPDIEGQEQQGLNTYTLQQRVLGYLDGMKKTGLEASTILSSGSFKEKMELFVKQNDFHEKTALLCLCDSYAIKAMRDLTARGVNIPGQVGIMGYDGIELLSYIQPQLATVKYSVHHMGEKAIEILLRCMEDAEYTEECLVEYSILDGGSLTE